MLAATFGWMLAGPSVAQGQFESVVEAAPPGADETPLLEAAPVEAACEGPSCPWDDGGIFYEPVITFEGTVRAEDDFPIEGAAVGIESPLLAESLVAIADADGYFYVTDLPPGLFRVLVSAPLYESLEAEEEVLPDLVTTVTYRLRPQRTATPFETVVRDRRPPRELSRRTLGTTEIVRMPGSSGDALRTVENLPGVARPTFGLGFVVIRGSAPQNTAFYVDRIQVPLLYHFGALRSTVAADFLERIDFFPGNYSVRYGGVTGGVLDVVPRTPDREAWHGYVDVNLIDAGAFAEGPIGDTASIAAGLRRSYIDAILTAVEDDLPFESIQAPVYWDYQLLADWDPSEADHVRFFVYGSDDRIVSYIDDVNAGGPELVGERSVATSFHRFQVEWRHRFSATLENRALVGIGYNLLELRAGQTGVDTTIGVLPIQIRDELTWQPTGSIDLAFGIDTTVQRQDIRLRFPDYFSDPESFGRAICTLGWFEAQIAGWTGSPGLYAETELRPVEGLRLIPGVRLDLFRDGANPAVDPRFTVRWDVVAGTTLKAGVGAYSQPPQFFQLDERSGNPDLAAERATHWGIGVEQQLWDRVTLQVDGFYRSVGNAIVASDRRVVRNGVERPIGFDNAGETRAYGLELLLRYEPDDLFFGWLAMTLMKAEQRDPDAGWYDAPFDQLLNLTAVGSFDLGAGWSVGFRFRVAQGYPYTPVVGAIYNADCDEWEPIAGTRNAGRLPWFHQLDLRVDKRFEWEHFALSVYLDVQNVYFHGNVEAVNFNYDYSEQGYTTGLPILPAIGIKGEFR